MKQYVVKVKEWNCPKCGRAMKFVEECEANPGERKTAWACDDCDVIVYVVEFN